MHKAKPRGLGKRAWFLTRLYRSVLIVLATFKVFNVTVHNRELVPKSGAAIIACNHISVADPVFLWGAVRRNAVAMAMAELWKMPGVNMLVRSLDHIPVVRGDKTSGTQAFAAAELILEHGGLLINFPEAKCARDNLLLPLKPGPVRLALKTGIPIIPVGIRGTDRVKPLGSWWVLRPWAHVDVRFGPPMDPADFTGETAVENFLDALANEISRLSGRPRSSIV